MLIQPDINELGDKRLDPKEGLAYQREKCLKEASKFKSPEQDEIANPDRSIGARLSYTEILSRLQRIVPELTAKEGSPGNLALYCPRTTEQLEAAIREGSGGSGKDLFFLLNRYVGGLPKEDLPEWGYVDIDTSLLATREHLRGYRTILIGLIRAGVLSYADAIAEFGDPATDQRSKLWMGKLVEWRENPTQRFTLRDYLEARK